MARIEEWWVELLDSDDRLIRTLDGMFLGGTYEQNANRQVRGGGTVELAYKGDPGINWARDRFKIWWTANGVDNPLGVFLVEIPTINYDDDTGLIEVSVNVMDKLAVLDRDGVDDSYSVKDGVNVVDKVKELILSTGESRIAVTGSPALLKNAMTWDAGTSKLQIVNDLLRKINYYTLRCDGDGRYRASPFVAVEDRPVARRFESGEVSVHVGQWSREDDWFDTPNKVVMISQGTGDEEAMRSIETNTDPASKYSWQSRGQRWILHVEKGVEANSQEVLDSLAKMRLGGLSTTLSKLSVEHVMFGEELLLPLVRYQFRGPLYDADVEVRSFSVAMTPGALVSASWREIQDV